MPQEIKIETQFILDNFNPDEIPGKTLYQYTHSSALKSIRDTKSIWATEHRYLNDPGEMRHGLTKFYKELENQVNAIGLTNFGPLLSYLQNNHTSEELRFFVSSFSQKGDLLSQWRGYGDYGCGLSIGFNATKIPLIQGKGYITWIKVIYDEQVQDQFVTKIVSSFMSYLMKVLTGNGGIVDKSVQNLLIAFLQVSQTASIGFKHNGWSEEEEWRLVKMFAPESDDSELFIRNRGSELIEYTCFNLEDDAIKEVYVGPRSRFENQSRAIQSLTNNKITILQSKIRWH